MAKTPRPLNDGESEKIAKLRFSKTKNMLYAVLAIGSNPDAPPSWALEACQKYTTLYRISREDVVEMKDLILREPFLEDKLLEIVSHLQVSSPELSQLKAIKQAMAELGLKEDESVIRTTQKRLKRETRMKIIEAEGGEKEQVVLNAREERLFAEANKHNLIFTKHYKKKAT